MKKLLYSIFVALLLLILSIMLMINNITFYVLGGLENVTIVGTNVSALEVIRIAELNITEMQELGFGTAYANDILSEAKILYSQGNFSGAEELARYVAIIKQTSINVDQLIDDTEIKIYDSSVKGINISPAQELFDAALTAFEVEDYVEAEKLVKESSNKVDEIEEEVALQRALERAKGFNIIKFAKEYWLVILTSIGILVIIGFLLSRRFEVAKTIDKIKHLEKEKQTIQNLMREAQQKYFEDGVMSKSEYDIARSRYQRRLIRIKKDIPTFQKKLEELKHGKKQRRVRRNETKKDL